MQEYVEPLTLSILLKKHPRSILLLDLRPPNQRKEIFKSENYLSFDPSLFAACGATGQVTTSQILESSLPLVDKDLFNRRSSFELLVYFDDNSTSVIDGKVEKKNLFNEFLGAIFHMEFNNIPRRKPLLLKGGIEALKAIEPNLVIENPNSLIISRKESSASLKVDSVSDHSISNKPHVPLVPQSIQFPHLTPNYNNSGSGATAEIPDLSVFMTPAAVPTSTSRQSDPILPPKPTSSSSDLKNPFVSVSPPLQPTPVQQTGPYRVPSQHQNQIGHSPFQPQQPMVYQNQQPNHFTPPSLHNSSPTTTYFHQPPFRNGAGHDMLSLVPPLQPQPVQHQPLHIQHSQPLPHQIQHQPRQLQQLQHNFQNTFIGHPNQIPMIPLKPTVSLPPPPLPQRTLPADRDVMLKSFTQKYITATTRSDSGRSYNEFGLTGLKNLGNTCFMNSIIQCITAYSQLTRYFLSGEFRKNVSLTNKMGTGGVLVEATYDLFKNMWSGEYPVFSPNAFKDAVCKFASRFEGFEQQDSQEFLAFFLDGLHEDLNWVSETKRPPLTEQEEKELEKLPEYIIADLEWKRYLERNFSIIVGLFQGQLRSRVQCRTCGKSSSTFNTFMYLSLPIVKPKQSGSKYTLHSCLDGFLAEEHLDEANSWYCPQCKAPREAVKKLDLWRLPPVMIFHFKRFSYDGPFRDKITQAVDFPLDSLNLWPYLNHSIQNIEAATPSMYDLFAVSNHYGNLSGGHYKAVTMAGNNGRWYDFDDSRVLQVSKDIIVKDREAAYILFYRRRI